jgi:hypothetical protein
MRPSEVAPVRPTLLSSCAAATTAAETRFRIDPPGYAPRETRVIGLDRPAARLVGELAGRFGPGSHFLAFESALPDDALLRRAADGGGGATALLSEELDGTDTIALVATQGESGAAAAVIGDAAAVRGIMCVGLVIPADTHYDEAGGTRARDSAGGGVVAALRPNAMVLVVLSQADDLPEVLSALRV